MTLKSFPRGGKKPAAKPNNRGLLFNKKEIAATKPKKNRGRKDQDAEPQREEKNYVAKTAESLTYSSVGEGMVLLGRIHNTTEYDMIVTLPGRLSGRLQVTDVSEAYTSLLQTIVKSEDSQPTEFKPLSELYKRGEYVVCYVKSLSPTEKWRVALSLEPELINRNLDPSRLCKGSKITGTISSVEDHGYVVDTGIDNLRSFLGVKDIDEGVQYYPGKQVFCAVKSVKTTENSTTAQLSTKAKHVATALREDSQSLDALVPGTKLVLDVQNVLSNGIQVSFNNGNVGYANRIYLDKPLDSYERGREIHGTLMYVMPTVKFAYFTLLPSDEEKERLNVGDTFENAKVLYTGNNGIVMSLKKDIRGLVPFRRTDVTYEKIPGIFSPESVHKCRVLAYDSLERIYICTMERELLEQKHLANATLTPGELLDVVIARIQPQTGYLMATVGRTKGWIAPEHIRDVDSPKRATIKIGDVVKARVLGRDKKQNGMLFTLKKSLIESRLPVLQDISEAKVGSKHHGTIVQINSKGLLVRFYDLVKGWVPSQSLDSKVASTMWNFIVGQTIVAKIEQVKLEDNKLTLSVFTGKKTEETPFEIGEAVEGTVVEASVEGVYVRITKDEQSPRTGFLPAGHIAPCEEVGSYLSARYAAGDAISALVFSTSPRFILTRTFVPREKYRDFKKLNVGDCLPCSIHEFTAEGLKLILPVRNFDSYGNVPQSKVDDVDALHANQLLFAKVTSIDRKHKKITLTTALHEVWNESSRLDTDLVASIDVTTLHFNKLRELSEHEYYKSKPISKAKIGAKVSGVVDKVTDHGLVLKLENDVLGTVRKDHYKGNVRAGDKINGSILWINYIHELVEVTLLPSLANVIRTKQTKLSKVSLDTQMRGDIVLVTNWFALVVLRGAGRGNLAALPTRRHVNDIEPDLSPYSIGKRIRCYVVLTGSQSDLLPICLVKSCFEVDKSAEIPAKSPVKKDLKRKSESSTNTDHSSNKMKKTREAAEKPEVESRTKKKTKVKKEARKTEAEPETSTLVDIHPESSKRKKLKRKVEEEILEPEVTTDSPVESDDDFSETNEGETKERLPECGFFWDNKPDESLRSLEESSSDDDEEEENEPKQKKKKKMSAAERRELEREKEREIREREEALASNQAPNSVDQFDRLVLSSPDSSMIWLRYMAYHLQATEIEKARTVAKRAIKTINFREEGERLNVWQAWLNLESRFGSSESLESVFQDAVRTNDALKVYLHMLTVHADAGRQSELDKIVTTIIGKFKHVAQIWVECGSALLKMGLKDKSRHVMQRALQSLAPQEHVNLMVKFAQMENKFGDKERAQTLFEQILSSYPKRVDVWSSYVDSLVKSGDLDVARKVLERAVVQTLPARKMKTLFKKFIAFEETHGSPEGVSHVQQLALKYVENQCSKESV